VPLEERGVRCAGEELVRPEDAHEQVAVGRHTVQVGGGERLRQPGGSLLAGRGHGDDLGQHRVVVRADDGAVLHAAVDPDAVAVRDGEPSEGAGGGQVAGRRVLGVEPGLDGVAREPWRQRLRRQRLAGGDEELEAHEVEPGDALRHRVLDLEPGVHLEEGERPVLHEEQLDRARPLVAHGPGGGHGRVAEPGPQRVVDGRRGRLLHHLLVAALDRALPLEERHHVAVAVGHHLHLDVAGRLDPRLQENRPVAEGGGGLPGGTGHRVGQVVGPAHDPHAAAPAAGRGLDQQRPAHTGGGLGEIVVTGSHLGGSEHRHAGLGHHRLGRQLGAHGLDGGRRWADEDEPSVDAGPGEAGVLGEEPVARVHGVGAGAPGGLHERVDPQVRVGRCGTPEGNGLVGLAHERRLRVGVAVHRHGGDAHRAARAEDPPGDLAPVGDEDLVDHRPRNRAGSAEGRAVRSIDEGPGVGLGGWHRWEGPPAAAGGGHPPMTGPAEALGNPVTS
jgi:hypothetical protein